MDKKVIQEKCTCGNTKLKTLDGLIADRDTFQLTRFCPKCKKEYIVTFAPIAQFELPPVAKKKLVLK